MDTNGHEWDAEAVRFLNPICFVEMMTSFVPKGIFGSRQDAKTQKIAGLFAPLRLCVTHPKDDFQRANPIRVTSCAFVVSSHSSHSQQLM